MYSLHLKNLANVNNHASVENSPKLVNLVKKNST
jgi:hypothetical protein